MDKNFRPDGYRVIDFSLYKSDIARLKRDWKAYAKQIPPYQEGFRGRGIVMCAGGLGYFTCCWIAIKAIRKLGCRLPIEVWYVGKEMSPEIKMELGRLGVECRDFHDNGGRHVAGYRLKPFAILKSRFKEVLYLDADNICVRDPAALFETKEYQEHGAMFWPDFWKTAKDNPIWDIVGSADYDMHEQESGQVLINKEMCWKEINLCQYLNDRFDVYYKLLLGDKDTFRFAWIALKKAFHMIDTDVATCGYRDPASKVFVGTTMVQHGPDGEPFFLHRNLLKWDVTKPREIAWRQIRRFVPGAVSKIYHINFSRELGHAFIDLEGDVEEVDFVSLLGDIETGFLDMLRELRSSGMYARFITHLHFAWFRLEPQEIYEPDHMGSDSIQDGQILTDSDYIRAGDQKFVI